AACGGLPAKAPRLSGCGAGGLFLALELHLRTVRRPRDIAVGAVRRPPCVFGGGVDVVLTAGQCVGSSTVRFAEYPGPHIEALADVVAQGFSIDAVLAVGARTVH